MNETDNILWQKTSFATGKIFLLDETKGEKFFIRPSDIIYPGATIFDTNLTAAFGKFDKQVAAHYICTHFKKNGDMWTPVESEKLKQNIRTYRILDGHRERYEEHVQFHIDPKYDGKYGKVLDDKIYFTNLFIERCAGFRDLNDKVAPEVDNVFNLKNSKKKSLLKNLVNINSLGKT